MGFDGHISESAFLVNESRSRKVELSLDRYAHLWVTDSTRKLWEDFSREVYPFDDIELGLRNHFFLDRLSSFISMSRSAVFVNIGAGFTSYPFLIDEPCRCVEVDFAHVIDFKRKHIAKWQKEGLLPKHNIDFLPVDLNDEPDVENMSVILYPWLTDTPSFVLLEGITYYLEMHVLENLFKIFASLQKQGSILAFDYWTPDVVDQSVFIRFQKFFANRIGYEGTRYNLFDNDFIMSIPGYKIIETTDIQELERVYSKTTFLADYDGILPEQYAVLMKDA